MSTDKIYHRQWGHDGPVNGVRLTADERRILFVVR